MINNNYLIDTEYCKSGGYCDTMPIKDYPELVFKSFKYKNKAKDAYLTQIKLSKLDLAPKVLSSLCKIPYYYDPELMKYWIPEKTITDWGFITEKACLLPNNINIPYRNIQRLVNIIYDKTQLKFWDSHLDNVGYIKRKGKKKLVCIDTGSESFNGYCNAWGFNKPGPQCPYCLKYQCKCGE